MPVFATSAHPGGARRFSDGVFPAVSFSNSLCRSRALHSLQDRDEPRIASHSLISFSPETKGFRCFLRFFQVRSASQSV